jgi:NADH-quinone oxidoreductase subunit K
MIGTNHYLVLSAILFTLGVSGVLIRRNALIVLMCIELMLNAVNLSFVAFARRAGQIDGHVIVFFVMAVAAAEAAIGLALVIAMFRHKSTVNLDQANLMKG